MKKPQAEKERNLKLKLPSSTIVEMDLQGRILDPEHDKQIVVNGRDLDSIVKRAAYFRQATEAPSAPTRAGNYDVEIIEYADQQNSGDKPGDVYIGCELVPFKLLKRVQALSQARRGKKSPAAAQQ